MRVSKKIGLLITKCIANIGCKIGSIITGGRGKITYSYDEDKDTHSIKCEDINDGYWFKSVVNNRGELIEEVYSDGVYSGGCETHTYDDKNNLIKVEGSDGYWRTHTYDDNNNLIKVEGSDGYWYTKTYDDNNNLIKFENSCGNWYTNTYDDNNNLIKWEYSCGAYR